MARKRHSDEDILKLLREIELALASGHDVTTACRSVGISDATYYNWRKRFGGMARSQLSEMKALEKENIRLKKILAELELDKLILKESLDFFKTKSLTTYDFRQAVIHVRQKLDISERRTCKVVGFAHSSLQYKATPKNDDALRLAMIRLAKQYGRYGYRKVAKLIRIEGWHVNHKKIERRSRVAQA
jgi:putative transposase